MKKITLFFTITFFTATIFAQQSNDILMTVGQKKVTADEFYHIYKKNNSDNLNKESLDEYLELFKNFKLKVVEAESLKMDTSKAFINELSGYRTQLAKPYLTENKKIEELIKEAYNRSKNEFKLDIIFIKVSQNASEKDTTLAYEKVLKIRDRIIQGEDFEKVAIETSDDRAVAKNKGHLSFLPALKMPYSIQSFVINTKKGTFSQPIRTNYGYYIVKLADKRKAKGFYKVAHIMISTSNKMTKDELKSKKEKIDSIYSRIMTGDRFEDLVKFSDDKGTAKKGGELPEFTTRKMVPEFENAAFALKHSGDISKPIKTNFGWHIIKLIKKRPQDSFEKQKDNLRKMIEKDTKRKEIIKYYVTKKLKSDYNFKETGEYSYIANIVDTSVFNKNWKMQIGNFKGINIFSLEKKEYTDIDLGYFIEKTQKRTKQDLNIFINNMYNDFIYETLVETEQSKLEDNNIEFKYLMQEYHDGMLLFDLMKKEIWDKASEDSIGLKKFFKSNANKYNNQIDFDISVFKYDSQETSDLSIKLLNRSRKKYHDEKLVSVVNKKGGNLKLLESGSFSKGENIYADRILKINDNNNLKKNQKIVTYPTENIFIYLNGTKKSKIKPFNEIKGLVISDYQNYIEKKWLKELSNKHKININKTVLDKIKFSLK